MSTLQKIEHEQMKIASSTGETFETSFDGTINDDISPTKSVLTGRKSADQAHHEKLRSDKFSHVLTSAPNLGMIISTYTTQMKQLISESSFSFIRRTSLFTFFMFFKG